MNQADLPAGLIHRRKVGLLSLQESLGIEIEMGMRIAREWVNVEVFSYSENKKH